MAGVPLIPDLVDPLSELNGPLLFPRAIRASVGNSVPIDSEDLDSIHEFMRSRGLRSPKKLMIEAKRIMDSRTAILDSNLASFAKNVNVNDVVSKMGKDMPRERRQGLGLARKRAPFSLKTSLSQPVSLEPTLNFDKLQDPDDFFDAYDRLENAKKEIQKQLGGRVDNANDFKNFKPSTKARLRRPGILGKSYKNKHRYPSVSFENDMLMSSQEAEQLVPSAPRDEPAEKLITLDSNLNIDSEEIESVAGRRKEETEVNSILDDFLSCNHEDLDGDVALNLLQERLQIKPLDLENLSIPELHDFPRTNKFSVRESVRKPHKTSLVIDNVLKNINGKQSIDHEHTAQNLVIPVPSPTPPRSPFASLSFLKKRILQSNPLRDVFSPLNVDLSERQTAHPVNSIDMLGEQVNAMTVSRISCELESHVEVEVTERTDSNIDPQKAIGCSNNLPHQFIDENASMQSEKAGSGPIEVPEYSIEETISIEHLNDNQSNPSVLEDEGTDAPSRRHNFDKERQPELQQTKFQRRKREADDELMRNELRKSLAESGTPLETEVQRMRPLEYGKGEKILSGHLNDDQSNLSVREDEATHAPSRGQKFDAGEQLEVHQTKLRRRKRETGNERLRKSHPLRKSLAESGTSFENGVRRSKRIKMRRLEYWKGERFLFGRVNESMKLIGVKYISPGKDNANLKVKPFILSDSSEYKDLLELAARH